ncbi:hypothetical protein A1O1_00091 [Capronia coronata CBS 617.96]|uniref:Uncharacterized protein n=1 Tax=Capronia coronata CBS 617.96 TaxID=1182541 RepID=W9YR10_9EURO|nr:uncharacterized protein A1O1_00091 [Capronia coronata CBS 617.96]EXJ94973.1 hypothetical protein A1O1_00091 [Capronia coronata CBS 617.96]
MTEGLFTSELGIRGDNSAGKGRATRTISLTDFQRRDIYGQYQHIPRPVLPRRNAGIYLAPRAPDPTVTSSVVEINVNDGTSTSKVTEVPAATTGNVLSLSDVGSVTVPGSTGASSVVGSSISDSSQETLTTPPPTPSPSDYIGSTTDLSSTASVFSGALNGTAVLSDATSSQQTATVTATSTFEVSYVNGTIIAGGSTSYLSSIETSTVHVTESTSSSDSATFTFGDPVTTSSSFIGSSTTITDSTGGFLGSPTAVAGSGAPGSATTSSRSAATSGSVSGSGSGSGSGGGSPGLTPTQQQVVGGVVGGVAGVAVVLIILLVVLRWYRRRLKARGELPEQRAARELTGNGGNAYPMSQRSSTVPIAAAVTNSLKRLRPHSNQNFGTTATGMAEPSIRNSERGFQRIAGRKIPPVLSSGGDPYGGNYGAFEKDATAGPSDPLNNNERGLSGASFYRDSDGVYGGKGTHSPTFPPSPITAATGGYRGEADMYGGIGSSTRDFAQPRDMSDHNASSLSLTTPSRPEGFAVMRPSPARTPVTLSPAASSIRLPIQQPPTMAEDVPPLPNGGLMPGPMQRDGLGRSLASQDGSRVSRSSGRSGGRFMENM